MFVWLSGSAHRDDVLYRIHFYESVSGLSLGDPVKFRGVDIGTVKAMNLDAADPQRVQVDVALRKDAPVKTDTKATLMMKGITGTVYIELAGGSVDAPALLAATPPGQIPEIIADQAGPVQIRLVGDHAAVRVAKGRARQRVEIRDARLGRTP